MDLTLAQAFRVNSSACMAFVGAGGKTTAMFQLARQLAPPVIVTATSHLGLWQAGQADRHIMAETPAPLEQLEHGLAGVILVTGPTDGDRLQPVSNHLLGWLKEFCSYHAIPLLIEADGSRQKPLKAWAAHEPPIPSFVETVVQVAGLTGLNRPVSADNVHRPEIFSKLSGVRPGGTITPEALVRVLTHSAGGLKNIPAGARRVLLLNQADTPGLQSAAQGLAQAVLPAYPAVVIASLEQQKIFAVHEPVAGIILAAGASTRYGRPKQLLDWKGRPFVRVVAQTALEAGLAPVMIVTGANAEQVEASVKDLAIRLVRNVEWESGQASSIKTAIRALMPPARFEQLPQIEHQDSPPQEMPPGVLEGGRPGAAIFLLVDQPQMTASILRALVEKHAQGLYPIVVPLIEDHRTNPVLFDRTTFPELLTLEGDVGGRAIFRDHRLEYLPWHDDRMLLDVDTPEMYQRLLRDETL